MTKIIIEQYYYCYTLFLYIIIMHYYFTVFITTLIASDTFIYKLEELPEHETQNCLFHFNHFQKN
jgi:hypothetical protein